MRETIKNDVPEIWRQRSRAGLCPVCGKTFEEFDKGMKVYCSRKCRDEYAEKFTHWEEMRDKILERDNHTCKKCNITVEKARKRNKDLEYKRLLKWAEENRDIINHKRDEKLMKLSKGFEEEYNDIMDDSIFLHTHTFWDETKDLMRGIKKFGAANDVDHIVPVALGGDMWDEKNMQTMCSDCHRKKTKKDMVQIRKQKKEFK